MFIAVELNSSHDVHADGFEIDFKCRVTIVSSKATFLDYRKEELRPMFLLRFTHLCGRNSSLTE